MVITSNIIFKRINVFIVEYLNNEFSIELFLTTLISNVLSLVFNVFVLLTAISMKHVLRSNPNQVVNYVKLEEDEK